MPWPASGWLPMESLVAYYRKFEQQVPDFGAVVALGVAEIARATFQGRSTAAFVRAAARSQRMAALAAVPELVAARRLEHGGWEMHVVRHGRLAAAGSSPPGAHPRPYVDALLNTAETVTPAPAPLPAATAEETECVLRWLEQPGARLVELTGSWTLPTRSAWSYMEFVEAVGEAPGAARPFDDRRGLRPRA